MQRNNGRGVAGLAFGGGLWMLSAATLAVALRQNALASEVQSLHRLAAAPAITRLHGAAVAWAVAFAALQVASFLVWAAILRTVWLLRAAVCYTLGAVMVMAGDCFGLFCLLVWLRISLGAN
jgi:hypothetical protein